MKKKGLSVTVTTVILTGIMITILGIALFLSNTVVEYHTQATEYQNSKNLMTYLADAIEQVALGSGGARYVRFSLRTARLDFTRDILEGDLEVRINNNVALRENPDALVLRGGNLLTAPPLNVLYPEGVTNPAQELEKYIVEIGEPVTLVYEEFWEGPATILVCRRVRVNYLGVYNVLKNGNLRQYNVFEVVFINLTIGRTGGAGTIPVVVRSKNITLINYYLDENSFTLSVYVAGQLKDQKTLSGEQTAAGTIVVVRISHIEIGTLG
ncbi:MAG: hypothetical protein DRJ38_06130 [Thermoprotei archaeon]|nr:MAG: hypothetical protein DRJ38_06130 [Thermoprotei archaeon]